MRLSCTAPPRRKAGRCRCAISTAGIANAVFASIGYHFVVYLDGTVHTGRPVDRAGAHCKGHNAHSIGICYVGGLDAHGHPKDTRTPAQKEALKLLVVALKTQYPNAKIYGHRQFANKACPCFDVEKEYRDL